MKSAWLSLLVVLGITFALLSAPHIVRAQEDDDGPASESADAADAGDDVVITDDEADAQQEQEEEPSADSGEAYETDDDFGAIATPEDLDIAAIFPEFTEKKLKLGEQTSLLIGISNRGGKVYNVSGVGAHLHHPEHYDYYIQNFTARRVEGAIVYPGMQSSVEYIFRTDPTLEASDYRFSAWVVFNGSDGREYMAFAYNETIQLEAASTDWKGSLQILLMLAGLGVVGYLAISSNSKPKKQIERGTRVEPEVEIYKQAATSKAVPRKKSARKL